MTFDIKPTTGKIFTKNKWWHCKPQCGLTRLSRVGDPVPDGSLFFTNPDGLVQKLGIGPHSIAIHLVTP